MRTRIRRLAVPVGLAVAASLSGLAAPPALRALEAIGVEECDALLSTEPDGRDAAQCVLEAAQAEGGEGPATSLLVRLGEGSGYPWYTLYLGNRRYSQADEALVLYRKAAETFRGLGDDKGELFARLNRSRLLDRQGLPSEAEAEVDRVIEIGTASDDPELRAWGVIALAIRLIERSEDLDQARTLLAGLEIPEDVVGARTLRNNRLTHLGNVNATIGRFSEAQAAYRELAEDAIEQRNRYLEATARTNLAWLGYERLLEVRSPSLRAETREQAERAMALSAEVRQSTGEAQAAWILGELTPGEEGMAYLRRCADVAESEALRSYCLNPLAARLAAQDPEAARETIRRSLELAQASRDPQVEARVWHRSIEVDWAVDPPEEALRKTRRALQVIEDLRSLQPAGSATQAGYFSRWSDTYAWVGGAVLREAGRGLDRSPALATGLEMQERSRARALADWLDRSDPDREREEDTGPASLGAVREALGPDEALLSFEVAPWKNLTGAFAGGSWLLAVTPDRVTVHELRDRSDLRNRIRLLEAAITRGAPDRGRETAAAVALYDDLLAGALARLPEEIDRLILVPDGSLHRLPFAALRASREAEPLGARYELVQVPSATLWLRWRRAEPAPAERPLLVLADPALAPAGSADKGPLRVASARGPSAEPEPSLYRDAAESYGPLPWARREGRAAVRALGGGLLLTDAEATEQALRSTPLGGYRIVHFGAHAVTDEDRPERSAVLLAPSPGGGDGTAAGDDDPRDGFLRSAEIAHLDLAGRIVVLASCRSAGGSTLRGEGVMSLARAFFQAGAHGVVASLWPLRDDESAAMFERFYDHLGRGQSVAAALHAARREAIEAGEPAAAWAGLVVLGDGSVVPLPGGRSPLDDPAVRIAGLALSVLAAALLVVAAVRRRRSRSA